MWLSLALLEPLRALRRNKTRSALSCLGVGVGIAAVVLVVAVGEGALAHRG